MNALKLLERDHSEIKNLFAALRRTGPMSPDERGRLFLQIRRELQIHSRAEEEFFYPAIKALEGEGRQLISQALEEHRQIDDLLTRISRLKLNDKNFDDNFETLVENVEHHIEMEEGEIFRFAQENCSEQQLEDIGQEIVERKQILDRQLAA